MSSSLVASGRPAEILVVDDNDNDAELMRLAFKRAKLVVGMHRVVDGEQCMAFLRKQPPYENTPEPDLIFLDLNMPRMDGREVMQELLKDESLRHLPVIVMTSSDADADVLLAHNGRPGDVAVRALPCSGTTGTPGRGELVRDVVQPKFSSLLRDPKAGRNNGHISIILNCRFELGFRCRSVGVLLFAAQRLTLN